MSKNAIYTLETNPNTAIPASNYPFFARTCNAE
jgi:hypothetical protein